MNTRIDANQLTIEDAPRTKTLPTTTYCILRLAASARFWESIMTRPHPTRTKIANGTSIVVIDDDRLVIASAKFVHRLPIVFFLFLSLINQTESVVRTMLSAQFLSYLFFFFFFFAMMIRTDTTAAAIAITPIAATTTGTRP